MRLENEFEIADLVLFKLQLQKWIEEHEHFCLLDSHSQNLALHAHSYSDYDMLAAAGKQTSFIGSGYSKLSEVDSYIDSIQDWCFGHLSYDLKNEIEDLSSAHPDHLQWPSIDFFQPSYLFAIKANKVVVSVHESQVIKPSELFDVIIHTTISDHQKLNLRLVPKLDFHSYQKAVKKLLEHIQRGDIYEANYCFELAAKQKMNPHQVYMALSKTSPTPFSAFYRSAQNYMLSASPERYLKKRGSLLISQPIKGTSPRGRAGEQDQKIKEALEKDLKERTENIMIVDLVRNDLSRLATRGSVKVEELCGIYTFSQVHQMISTITAELNNNSFKEIISATFPMGSMTGAPKIKAMQLIDQYETSRRGLYSGAVGYISPSKDFDFNVVIRSLQYNARSQYLSYMVGSAITAMANPEKEYDECLLKAKAIESAIINS